MVGVVLDEALGKLAVVRRNEWLDKVVLTGDEGRALADYLLDLAEAIGALAEWPASGTKEQREAVRVAMERVREFTWS